MKLDNPLLRRAFLYLEDGEWGKADDYCEQVLDQEPENAMAYVIKLMARLKVDKIEKLGEADSVYEQWNSYRNAYRFADEALKQQLEAYLKSTKYHIEESERRRKAEQEAQKKAELEHGWTLTYNEGLQCSKENATVKELKRAQQCFLQVQDFADAKERAAECEERIAALEQKQKLLLFYEEQQRKRKRRKKWLIAATLLACLALLVVLGKNYIESSNAERAKQIERNLAGKTFIGSKIDVIDSDSGGSFSIVGEMAEYSYSYSFNSDGTVKMLTTKYYDSGAFVTKNGQRQWDSVQKYEKIANWGQVEVSMAGKITMLIDGSTCELKVKNNNVPISFVMDGITYQAG